MCLNPLKGFIDEKYHVIKVARNADYVLYRNGKVKAYSGDPPPDAITDYIDLPCRQCYECFEIMRREWTTRAVAESMLHEKRCFITLTYDDEHLPLAHTFDKETGEAYVHGTLKYEDFQLFMKRLRKCFDDRKIRYFVCGEYGSRTYRPHYHAIIYGLDWSDFYDAKVYNRNKSGDLLFKSDYLSEDIWKKGFCVVGECSIASCAYVAGYVSKKFTNIRSRAFYELTDIVPPFVRSSSHPGLGRKWLDENIDNYKTIYDYISVPLDLSQPARLYLTEHWKKIFEFKQFQFASTKERMYYEDDKAVHRHKFSDNTLKNMIIGIVTKNEDEYRAQRYQQLKEKYDRKVRDF